MLFYVALYAVTLLLIIASQYVKKRWKAPIFSLLLVVVSIVILCFVHAARDVSIGTDTKFYPLETFNGAKDNGLSEFMAIPVVGHEYLYYLIVYVCSTVFNSFSLLLFITELLCVAPVFLS